MRGIKKVYRPPGTWSRLVAGSGAWHQIEEYIMLEKIPDEITLCTLEVVVLPNGEVICLGNTVGWHKNLKEYLTIKEVPKNDGDN